MNILIADDEPPAILKLRDLLKNYSEITKIYTAYNGLEALDILTKQKPDVAFLDITMPGLNGLEVVSQSETKAAIIFTTAHKEYALEAFEKNAIDYLLKPVNRERMDICMKKIMSRSVKTKLTKVNEYLENPQNQITVKRETLAIPCGDKYQLIPFKDICLIQIEVRDCRISTLSHNYSTHQKLDYYERILPEYFFKTNRSELINLNQVKEVIIWFNSRYKILLKNAEEVIVSRERSRVLKDVLSLD